MNSHAEAESAAADFSNAIKARKEVLDMYKANIQRLQQDVDR